MHFADWIVLASFFLVTISIGVWAYFRVKDSGDFFTAGGKLPWWLTGVSHHVTGYSGAVFVAYAGIAYSKGFTIYCWWALEISAVIALGAFLVAPRWSRMRKKLGIQSPTEYLSVRYNVPTQQIIAWSGVLLKIFDVGAKWAAIAILLNVFTGLPLNTGIFLAGAVSLIYITIGGLWADVVNDMVQFLVQLTAGSVMLVTILSKLGGIKALWTMWDRLPASHAAVFSDPFTPVFAGAYLLINFLSYNGGTWHLAVRYISSARGSDARKAAILSSALYLVWPLILFFPMWAAPIFFPNLVNPEHAYAKMALEFLPAGLVGLVLSSMFASTLAMTASDSNTISAVVVRDILPKLMRRTDFGDRKKALRLARIATFSFTSLTVLIALNARSFGGVLGLIISWYGALVGTVAIPMILGLLPWFRRSNSFSAILSIISGLAVFASIKYFFAASLAAQVGLPVATSACLFIVTGLFFPKPKKATVEFLAKLKSD
jgi:SSS family solute:Na+ symporter